MSNGTFANGENLLLSGVVLGIIVVLNRIPVVWMRSCAIVIALAVGYALAGYLGRLTSPACTRPSCSRYRPRCTSA